MRKILIRATCELANRLDEKLRHSFDVQVSILDERGSIVVCEILAEIQMDWVTVCRFARNENLNDILTMFRVNLALKTKRSGAFLS